MTLALRAGITTAGTEDGLVLLDECAGRYWQLNNTGALVLEALLDGGTLDDAARRLTDVHPTLPAAQAVTDVADILESLRTAGLVTG